jgi:hypothetical protein
MGKAPVHLEIAGDCSKSLVELSKVKIEIRRIELYARQKKIGFLVSMLIGEQDVAVVAENEIGNRSDDAFTVRTGDEKDG